MRTDSHLFYLSLHAGFVEEPNKGTLEYTGCNDSKGKGEEEEGGRAGGREEARREKGRRDGHVLILTFTLLSPTFSDFSLGNWLLKPARIANGQIRFSAR